MPHNRSPFTRTNIRQQQYGRAGDLSYWYPITRANCQMRLGTQLKAASPAPTPENFRLNLRYSKFYWSFATVVVISLRCIFTSITDEFDLLGVSLVWEGWTGSLLQMIDARGISYSCMELLLWVSRPNLLFSDSGGAKRFLRRGYRGARWV